MTGILIERRILDIVAHIGRTAREHEGRDRPRHLQVKEHWRLTANHQKLGRGIEQILPHNLRRNRPCWYIGLGIWASRTVRRLISVVEASQFVVLCYDSLPSKPIYKGCLSSMLLGLGVLFSRQKVIKNIWKN